jgi:hypothetical protein
VVEPVHTCGFFLCQQENFDLATGCPKEFLVPPAVYELSDHDWINLEVIREITNAIKIVQEELEGEQYITGSRVIPLLEGVRARLDSTWSHFEKIESPSGKFVEPRGFGWRIHCCVEVTLLSTNKQHTLSI